MTRPSWIGQTLGGRYRIDDILGQGGMSAVYKAYDPNLKRVVAVKMIHAHLAEDPRFVVRFEEEATAVAQLRHPNIVQVYDFNHDDDVYYMVQEFVAGETLQERLRRLNRSGRRMALDEAIRYTVDISNAAGYAHKRGLVHRDIKPANIMIDVHGQAILMDFGIVKITGGEKHTATGAVVGTALYLPPESIRGESPDSRSDQYSLAVTLFEAVSGRPPFEADSAMTLMMMHLNDPLPDLRQMRPEVPAGLVRVIEKALSKSREQRYESMEDFAAALHGLTDGTTAPAVLATLADPQPPSAPAPVPTPASASPAHDRTATDPPAPAPAPTRAPAQPIPPVFARQANPAPEPPPPMAAASASGGTPPRARPNLALWGGIGAGLVVILVVAGLLMRGLGGGNAPPPTTQAPAAPSATQAVVAVVAATPTSQPSATLTPTITPTSAPTATPTITLSPTPTIPAGVSHSRINNITINEAGFYVVDYETFEYTETLPGHHVHFFFDTVPQEQAGVPGSGPWKLYGGPRPFDEYRPADRPAAAIRMCILVADPGHSVLADSGNCFILPDVNVAVTILEQACLGGPGGEYPELARFNPGTVLQVTGISADEAWWTVANPATPGESCWLARSLSDFSGDMSTLALAETPPQGAGAGLSVQITGISLDDQGRYVVDFIPNGFTPALPGTHMHFFFDIFTADQVGSTGGGNRLMFGGTSPFSGFTEALRPEGASQICVLVANPDHSVVTNSGNCFALP